MTGRSARLSDVAERAGVSKATASNVFNRPHLVREEVRARVLAEADAIGYAGPDPRGRMLSAGKVNAIGVATGESLGYFFDDPFARALMTGITEACDASGIGISLISSANEDALAWSIRSAVVDGLVLFCVEDAARLIAAARERRLPFVALSFGDTADDVSVVGVDDFAGARTAAAHLTGLGHRRFAILSFEFGEGHTGRATPERIAGADYATARIRVEGYLAALADAGIPAAAVPVHETATTEPATADAALAALFAAAEPPTALLCSSDRIALRALAWLKARGVDVPGAVSVIGFDGVPEGALADPPLTTVAQPAAEMGRHAVAVLTGRRDETVREILPVELVRRSSTAGAPTG